MRLTRPIRSLALALALVLATPGCKSKGSGASKKLGKVAVPEQVLATVAIKSPEALVDGGLALIKRFIQLPLSRPMLLAMLLSRAKLHRDLIIAVDTKRPLHLVMFDDRKLPAERSPALLVLPILSRSAFDAALKKRMIEKARTGDVVTYRPRPGTLAPTVNLVMRDRYAVLVSSPKIWKIAGAFAERNLVGSRPAHALVATLHVKNVKGKDRKKMEADLERALGKMRERMKSRGEPAAMIDGAQKALRGYADILLGTDDLSLAVDLGDEGVSLMLRATAGTKGRFHEIVKRQRSGEPFGYKLLPKRSFLVIADRGNPGAQKEAAGLVQHALNSALRDRPKLREGIAKLYKSIMRTMPGDLTFAAHSARGKDGARDGLALSAVARVTDAKATHAAMDAAATSFGKWIRAEIEKNKAKDPQGAADAKDVKVEKLAFEKHGAKGTLYKISVPQSADEQRRMEAMLGSPLTLGWAMVGKHALFVVGKHAAAQLELMAAGAKSGAIKDNLSDNVAFKQAVDRPGRVGRVFISVVDMVRTLHHSGVKALAPFGADLAQVTVQHAPTLDWGVDKDRKAFDITLKLPASHFVHFKPFLAELLRRRQVPVLGGGGGGNGGGAVPPIPPDPKAKPKPAEKPKP
ncbi:MAG: hypothetical protein KC503_35490 [Myxococcales bacterium]|nr:hypothetical protein [Myxococcales bacterium]